jgi:hypothetical protein
VVTFLHVYLYGFDADLNHERDVLCIFRGFVFIGKSCACACFLRPMPRRSIEGSWYAAFIASALQLGASCWLPAAAVSLPLEKGPGVRWVGGCVNARASLVAVWYGEIACPSR